MNRQLDAWSALLIFCLMVGTGWAQDHEPCASPRAAAQTFLDNLQQESWHPEEAAGCFMRPDSLEQTEVVARVKSLKAVLDHRGLFVTMEDLPEDPKFMDERGRHQVRLVEGFSPIVLHRIEGRWIFPESVMHRIPRLYGDTFSGWVEAVVQRLPPSLRARAMGYELWQLLAVLLLLMLCGLVSRVVRMVVERRLVRFLARFNRTAASDVLTRAAKPLGVLVATGLFAFVLADLRLPVGSARVLSIGTRVVAALAAVLLAYRLVDLVVIGLTTRAAATASKADDQLVVLLRKSMRVLVAAIGAVFVLQNLSVDVTGLLAGLGIGGLALALAAKDTAANLFGSITILVDQPFYVGDWIKAAGVEGTVIEIGLRSTRVRTFYDSEVNVPNSKLANSNIDNYSRRSYRRLRATLGIGYDSTPEQIRAFVEGIRAIIRRHPDTRKDYYEVHFTGYGDSSLEILLYTFFLVPTWSKELQARQRLLLEIMALAETVGVSFAFPTQTLHLETVSTASEQPERSVLDREELRSTVLGFGPGGKAGVEPETLTHGYFAGDDSARGDEAG